MRLCIICLFLVNTLNVFGQERDIAPFLGVEGYVNTIGGNSIFIEFKIDFENDLNGFIIYDDVFDDLNPDLKIELISKKNSNLITGVEVLEIAVSRKSISFTISEASDELISLLSDSIADVFIKVDSDILFDVINDSDEVKHLKMTKLQIEKNSRSKSFLTEAMARELIEAKGGELSLVQNKFDLGVIPSAESITEKTEYTLSFGYRKRYSFIKKIPVYFYAKGLVGTNKEDSLNFLSIYPVNYNFFERGSELVGQLGVDGNQDFSNYRITANFYYNAIIGNLVDFTFGEDRLRLKPVIKIGAKLYKEIENNRPVELADNEFSNQIFGEFYYYVPIHKMYSLILDGSVIYDFNSNVNPDEKFMFTYSVVFGIDIPKTDFKTIFKYVKGGNGISYESNDYVMIGLMIDMFE